MNKFIKSTFWKFKLSDVLFNKQDVEYVVFQLGFESFTLPKHQVSQNANGEYDIRIKHFDVNGAPKKYQLYKADTKEKREVGVDEIEKLLNTHGYILFDKPKERTHLYL